MNWHERYTQQARWTEDLRRYLLEKAGIAEAKRVLEAGCGTGAILSSMNTTAQLHGLDISRDVLNQARIHIPRSHLACGDVLNLPYPNFSFDITLCHFLMLWVKNPLQAAREMARVTRPGGNVLALAEPDYSKRVDKPDSLSPLGRWQAEALRQQGADPEFGARLADTFRQAGIEIVETGIIQKSTGIATRQDWELEWQVLEADLEGSIPDLELKRMKRLDEQVRVKGVRNLFVPTYFAWGRV